MPASWNPTMSTGIPVLDEQHKELIDQINILIVAMSQGKGVEQIEKSLELLDEYAKNHFELEESCMEKYQCPVAGINKKAHKIFIKTFNKLREQAGKSDSTDTLLAIKIGNELVDWFINHIMKVDTNLKICVKQ